MGRAVRPFLLGRDRDLDLVLRIGGERARLAVHRHDAETVLRARPRAIVAPQEALDRKFVAIETGRLGRIVGIVGILGVGDDRLEDLERAQPFRPGACRAGHLALESEALQAFAARLLAVERDQYRVGSRDCLDAEIAVAAGFVLTHCNLLCRKARRRHALSEP